MVPFKRVLAGALIAASAAFFPAFTTPESASAATVERQVGTISFSNACWQQKPYAPTPALKDNRNPYTWTCYSVTWYCYRGRMCSQVWSSYGGLDLNKYCAKNYGAGAYAKLAYYDPQGWRCYKP